MNALTVMVIGLIAVAVGNEKAIAACGALAVAAASLATLAVIDRR